MGEAQITRTCNPLSRYWLAAAALLGAAGGAGPALADSKSGDLAAYVRARAADADGLPDQAVQGYAAALTALPRDREIAARAYRVALLTGDVALERRARAALQAMDQAPSDAWLLTAADAVAAHDMTGFARAADALGKGPFDFMVPAMRAWATFADNPKAATALLDMSHGNPLGARFANENRALLLIASGQVDDGVALLQVVAGVSAAAPDLRIAGAQLLAGQGRRDQALALLSAGDRQLSPYRAALGNGVKPGSGFGIARLYLRVAANLADGKAAIAAVALARAALRLEPGNDQARVTLAQALVTSGATAQAIHELDAIAPGSPVARSAEVVRIAVLNAADQRDHALLSAQALATTADASSDDVQRYADLLATAGKFDDAAAAYHRASDLAGDDPDWVLLLQQGGALDRAGRWAEARPALERALALSPQSPIALNYLGYAELEHGGDPHAAAALLERAVKLRPDDYSILDSLAWAYFLGGDAARALPMLERAAQGEPANATINEHLGDVYWAVGRYYEARYAWRAARLTADADDAERLMAKIANGPTKN